MFQVTESISLVPGGVVTTRAEPAAGRPGDAELEAPGADLPEHPATRGSSTTAHARMRRRCGRVFVTGGSCSALSDDEHGLGSGARARQAVELRRYVSFRVG